MKEKYINPDFLRMLGILKNRNFIGPEFVYFNLTRRCNLNCLYCKHHSVFKPIKEERKIIDLPFDKAKELLIDFSRLNVKRIWITSDGEPFLYPEIDNLIKFANENGLAVHINTNGTFGSNKLKLLPFIENFIINLSAASEKTYEKLQDTQKRGMFYKVLKNIKVVNKIRKKHGLNTIINVNYIINKLNFREVHDFIKLSERIGIDRVHFRIMNKNKYNKPLILSDDDVQEFKNILKTTLKTQPNTNIKDIYEIFQDPYFLKSKQEKKKYGGEISKVRHCYMGWLGSYININGDVFICCAHQSQKHKLNNIYKQNFYNIWNSNRYQKLRVKHKNKIDTGKRHWKSCRICWFVGTNESISERIKRMEWNDNKNHNA